MSKPPFGQVQEIRQTNHKELKLLFNPTITHNPPSPPNHQLIIEVSLFGLMDKGSHDRSAEVSPLSLGFFK